MEDTLINLYTAKLVKEKGFNWMTDYLLPTQSLVQKWLRGVHNIHITIKILSSGDFLFYINHFNNDTDSFLDYIDGNKYHSYEEALEIALFEALKKIDNIL